MPNLKRRRRLARWLTVGFLATIPFSAQASLFDPPTSASSGLSVGEMAYLRDRLNRDGVEREMDRRITDALRLTTPAEPPLTLRGIGFSNPSHGDGYFMLPLPDERLLIGRREWTGRIDYWVLLNREFQLEGAILVVVDGVSPLNEEQAQGERQRVLDFLKSNVPATGR